MTREEQVKAVYVTLRNQSRFSDEEIRYIAEYLVDNGIGTKDRFKAKAIYYTEGARKGWLKEKGVKPIAYPQVKTRRQK